MFTLSQLHAELAGKFLENRNAAVKIKTAMLQVEAVMQMLQPGFNVRSIAAKRRNKSNPWFKRGTLFRSAMDVLRRAGTPMTAREITDALIANKAPQATRKQAIDLQAAIFLDNARYHHAKIVREWLAQPGRRIKLHFIPPYCPHLNPIERLWGVMHKHVTHNKSYATCAQFADATLGFLREKVPRNWADLCDSVTDNFRIINPKDFRVVT
jgi:transposase